MLDKTYEAAAIEPRIFTEWERADAFRAGAGAERAAASYCIVIPPPNVTGSLHMGHALNNTLQDVLVRFERMRGRDVLWQPGTDHAGIATQMVMERRMAECGEPDRRTIGRTAFLDKMWAWKAESEGTIIGQLKRLGCSCDWSRGRFTLDEGLSAAVVKVFVALYKEGLIYRDKRLVNWDPKLLTAISDLEVQQVETQGHLWHFRYPIEGEAGRFITVATTRPETMLGDTGVAVHPDDERYRALVGKHAILPLVGRRIRIVADEYADPEAGSGAVKITPAHDFNDFEVGRRHGLRVINVMSRSAEIAIEENHEFWEDTPYAERLGGADEVVREIGGYPTEAMDEYVRFRIDDPRLGDLKEQLEQLRSLGGLDRFAARERIVAMIAERGLLEKVEEHVHSVPHGDRSGVPIEPYLTDQWYVDAKTLSEPAIQAARDGRTRFVPKQWERTYFDWMENIQPWCISRQLWWGHQIPVWYGPEGGVFCEETEAAAIAAAESQYGRKVEFVDRGEFQIRVLLQSTFVNEEGKSEFKGEVVPLTRDPDVLDTWFSSALWPFSTLGWPEETAELRRYYPTSVLVTGFDIIFFWVARMMMMGLHFMKEVPFGDVYIHALVRDEHGAKMSKSKGNVIDPLELIDEYGADALRFTLSAMAAQGRDIKLAPGRVAGYRNFGTKLWNAARFCQLNGCRPVASFRPADARLTVNRWILTEAGRAAAKVTAGLEAYRFNEAADAIYHFTWHAFCDWYVELIKPVLAGEDAQAAAETRATAAYVLDVILKLLHPFMPFISEELWGRMAEGEREGLLMLSRWPSLDFADEAAADEINLLVELISEARSARQEVGIAAAARIPLVVAGASKATREKIAANAAQIGILARTEGIGFADAPPPRSIQFVVREATVAIPVDGFADVDGARARLEKEIARIDGEIARLDKKLANEKFLAKAPPEVVEADREKRADYATERARLEAALRRVQEAA
jgi:valyl-tRNA synthetase